MYLFLFIKESLALFKKTLAKYAIDLKSVDKLKPTSFDFVKAINKCYSLVPMDQDYTLHCLCPCVSCVGVRGIQYQLLVVMIQVSLDTVLSPGIVFKM